MIDKLREEVAKLLNKDNTGHSMDHVDRVTDLANRFAINEKANTDEAILISMLHDVDDYKLFGDEYQEN